MWIVSRQAMALTLASALLGGVSVVPVLRAQQEEDRLPEEVKRAVDGACRWLRSQQNADGGYGPYGALGIKDASDVGITAFALYALAKNPREYQAVDGPFISRAVDFLLERQQDSGAFYDRRDPTLRNYKTSVAVLALTTLSRTRYAEAVRKAQAFLRRQQLDETGGFDPERHLSYGGVGYGSGLRPDLSNTQYNLDAQVASGVSADDELFKKAILYVTRCLNTEEVDVLLKEAKVGTSGDGGARYGPNITRGPVETVDGGRIFSSYGSMTYAALKAFLYAKVEKDDPRVKGLFRWIQRNWTVTENPGMARPSNPQAGRHGYYYYLHTMTKALALYGEPTFTDASGSERDWAREVSEHLLATQDAAGYWVNSSDRWYENLPALDTAYAVVSLVECLDELQKRAQASPPPPDSGEKG